MKGLNKKKLYYRIFLSVGLFISINFMFSSLSYRFNIKWDMTENKLYKISDETEKIIKNLTDEVYIYAISSKDDMLPVISEILDVYRKKSLDKICIEYVDPYENPDRIDKFIQEGLQVSLGGVVVEGKYEKKSIAVEELFKLNSSNTEVEEIYCERVITSAIAAVDKNVKHKVAFTVGHNEIISNELVNLFEKSNCEIKNIPLLMYEIDSETEILVISSPSSDFSDEEIDYIDTFLKNGGNILFFAAPIEKRLNRLYDFLQEWGIGVSTTVIKEPLQHVNSNKGDIVPIYANHNITEYFSDNQILLVMPSSVFIEPLYSKKGNIKTHKLLYTTGRAEVVDNIPINPPYVVGMLSEKEYGSKILAIGSREMYRDNLMKSDIYGNSKFLAQSINYCLNSQDMISIPSKIIDNKPILITLEQIVFIGGLILIVFPVLILVVGLIIYVRRHHS